MTKRKKKQIDERVGYAEASEKEHLQRMKELGLGGSGIDWTPLIFVVGLFGGLLFWILEALGVFD
tara:strand:+ start:368 stop:562 length:195 start_codon:yes stop_codon:yes gene_type:complete